MTATFSKPLIITDPPSEYITCPACNGAKHIDDCGCLRCDRTGFVLDRPEPDPFAPDTECAICGRLCRSQAEWNVDGPFDDVYCETCYRCEIGGPF